MEITNASSEVIMLNYVEHKKEIIKMEKFLADPESNPLYMYHKGCCDTAENCLKHIGISPNCKFIKERL